MFWKYEYGTLEDELVTMFRTASPDFQKAEELVALGADLNATSSNDNYENMLAEILIGYWYSAHSDDPDDYTDSECGRASYKNSPNSVGETMLRIIRFFLDYGFDVTKNDGRFGSQCLAALVLSTFDQYMLKAARLLFDVGAVNTETDDYETVLEVVGAEASFQDFCEHDHHLGNLYEAFYQIVTAHDDGRAYQGIDYYQASCDKRIIRVLAEKPTEGPVFFSLDLPTSKHKKCFRQKLYFEYDGGYLITREYADLWTDTVLPDVPLVDVSDAFPGIVGNRITQITFDHNEISKGTRCFGQPIVIIEMDTGVHVRFTTNFGEVEDEYQAAYFSLQ